MKIKLINHTQKDIDLVKAAFPGIEIVTEPTEITIDVKAFEKHKLNYINYLKRIAHTYMQEYVEDPEDPII